MKWFTPADIDDIKTFLRAHVETSMFPLSNIDSHGIWNDAPRSVGYWIARRGGEICDVLTITREGMVMPQLPSGDYFAAANVLLGRELIGIIGPMHQVRGLQSALDLMDAPATLNHDEPQFVLPLDQLKIPDGRGDIVPLADAPKDTIIDWMTQYQIEGLSTPAKAARVEAEKTYGAYIAQNSHVALMDGDTPLAMTGFNARLPEIVQIGGVFTPTDLRSNGYARRALALHLAQTRNGGATRATLFASGPPAIKAYKALGFRQIGEWTLLLFDGTITPKTVSN